MCINACGIQDNILKRRFISTPYVLKLDGRDYKIHTLWVLCSYFLFYSIFIPFENLWACIVFSLMKVEKLYPHCLFLALLLC